MTLTSYYAKDIYSDPNLAFEFPAIGLLRAGINVVPIKKDGSKRPARSWKHLESTFLSEYEALMAIKVHNFGFGAVTGSISGGLEVLDFDDPEFFEPWRKQVESIVCWLPVVETAGGGFHVYYRCDEVTSSKKIAFRDDGKIAIETRGEGAYVVAAGNDCSVHRSGMPYIQVAGPFLPEIPRISTTDRVELWRAARSLDKGDSLAAEKKQIKVRNRREAIEPPADPDGLRNRFAQLVSWSDILSPHGWRHCSDGWIRPGKTDGVSATTNQATDGNEVLTVFSANAGPLAPVGGTFQTWGKFQAWKALNFGNDWRTAYVEAHRLIGGIRR